MATIRSVKDLKVWRKAMDLTIESYRATARFPDSEKFGLTSQIRRAAASVPANIAEGFGRWNQREFSRFLSIASGSARELETHMLIAGRLGYLSVETLNTMVASVDEVSGMLFALKSKVQNGAEKTKSPQVPS
ncbi:MAG TPA: four helix bundle protein [Candidatus Acidoferrum sp.]|nr:four helix bundle protein [Candidatus Acidoferrum sp.]